MFQIFVSFQFIFVFHLSMSPPILWKNTFLRRISGGKTFRGNEALVCSFRWHDFSRVSRAQNGENFMCKFESEGNFLVDVIFHRCLRIVWILFAEVAGLWVLKKGTNKCFISVDPFVVPRLNIVWKDIEVLLCSGLEDINNVYR